MNDKPAPIIRTFEQAPAYDQHEPGDARFNWLIQKDEVPGLCVGRVRLAGPIKKTPAAHDAWEQAYIILQGHARVHVGDACHHVDQPAVIIIPRDTMHWVEVDAGKQIEYIFINQYR